MSAVGYAGSMATEQYTECEKPELITLLCERDNEIAKLQNIIRNANRRSYGVKTEQLSADQLKLSFENELEPEAPEEPAEIIVEEYSRKVTRGRKPLPDDLPREEIRYEPSETHCACCGEELRVIGEVKTEELEKIPEQLKVIEHIRVKKACARCKGSPVLIPPLPPAVLVFERSRPGPGLVASVLVAKYIDAIPLFRQEEMFRRQGIELSRKRLCDWVARSVELLLPLYEALHKEIFQQDYVQADETSLKVQDGEEPGKCHTGYLWGVHAPSQLVWFRYDKSRSSEVSKKIFEGFTGTVQTDAYAGYTPALLPGAVTRLACLAHIRRKFIDVRSIGGADCDRVLKRIAEIYHVEKRAKTPEERLALRVTKTQKLLEQLFEFLDALNVRTLPKSPLAGAVRYALGQRTEAMAIMLDGRFDLDNNGIERLIRPIAIGRKNYLFAGSHDGAHRAAVLYSLFGTCKLNKVNPWEWMKDVLIRVQLRDGGTAAELLPHRWRAHLAA